MTVWINVYKDNTLGQEWTSRDKAMGAVPIWPINRNPVVYRLKVTPKKSFIQNSCKTGVCWR